MAKIALCHYALGDIQEAKGGFEVVIEQSKRCHPKMSDFMQISEILNNLGCISFKSNQPETALLLFRDALEIQQSVMKQSLYGGPKLVAHDTSMKISVIRSNIGYVKLVTNDQSGALTSFESALAVSAQEGQRLAIAKLLGTQDLLLLFLIVTAPGHSPGIGS
jgi:tetratricopeptide (TPR) repeat protein